MVILQDVRSALRGLARSRTYTALAVLMLALGIAVSTAMFSVIHAVLLRGAPYPDGGPPRHPAPEISADG
jgi:putative ABC transport system permease protein